MLKIKADRMKDLAKFGFNENIASYTNKRYSYLSRVGFNVYKIFVEKDNGILHFSSPTLAVYDLLFDLIKADMVEKVEE